jgi:endonuclease YncB( thermonuclease family)
MEIQDNYIRHIHSIHTISDGDTISAYVHMGYDKIDLIHFRFTGINTAEMKSKKGTQRYELAVKAKEYVTDVLTNHKVRVHSEKFEDGGFGRYLGVMYYEKDGNWINLNQELLDKGLAQVYYLGASKDFGEWKA